jgi:hypothetical protein
MPLQTGTWTINSSGNLGTLVINSVDTVGNVTGSLNFPASGAQISGFWDEISGRLSFVQPDGASYVGFLFQDQFRMPGITGSVVSTLAGYVHVWSGSFPAGNADKPILGWYAQIGSV